MNLFNRAKMGVTGGRELLDFYDYVNIFSLNDRDKFICRVENTKEGFVVYFGDNDRNGCELFVSMRKKLFKFELESRSGSMINGGLFDIPDRRIFLNDIRKEVFYSFNNTGRESNTLLTGNPTFVFNALLKNDLNYESKVLKDKIEEKLVLHSLVEGVGIPDVMRYKSSIAVFNSFEVFYDGGYIMLKYNTKEQLGNASNKLNFYLMKASMVSDAEDYNVFSSRMNSFIFTDLDSFYRFLDDKLKCLIK